MQKEDQHMSRTFKGYVPKEVKTFDLESPEGITVTITCKPSVPGAVFLDFLGGVSSDEDFSGMARITKDVLNACIADADQDKFWAFCNDPANGIDIETLSEIAGYLSELFSGERPTEPSPV
jgi:hypothetical protein